ncbi:hypothetical protein ATO6_15480 [Oceanicola sp. 22II-s10i]|uniref:DUF2303 family protein n=1 Tax=Oceanicola sp. 22II-s10i TaxID=1317116 RepID=UPI000B527F5C|nr:DUF2303 family protein [Oceanicola sp. 22II-s10i]OWU83829.1 hypothetical protein ATO6_15480 [Oceanicola sp. 22II-s10i]
MTDELFADPRGSLDAAIDAARLAQPVIKTDDGREFHFVPAGHQLIDHSDPFRMPPYIHQQVVVDDRASLVAYANRFSDDRSIILADINAGTIKACLDWHTANQGDTPNAAQPGKHSVTLKLQDSEEYARWDKMEGGMHAQADFAMFIEENVADVEDPDHSTLLEICRDLEATQGTVFRSGVRLENGDRSFTYETETKVKGTLSVPTEITLAIPLYHGEDPVTIRAKFRFKVSGDGLLLGFRWHRVEYQRQATFRAMAFQAAEETGLLVMFGRA